MYSNAKSNMMLDVAIIAFLVGFIAFLVRVISSHIIVSVYLHVCPQFTCLYWISHSPMAHVGLASTCFARVMRGHAQTYCSAESLLG